MRVRINPVLDIDTGTWSGNEYEYTGPVILFGGPSAAAEANQAAQTQFYNQVTGQQTQAFAEQQQILQDIQNITLPILNQGPNQYGFTPEEDAALRGEIVSSGAQAEANAVDALQLREKQASGGTNVMPTGAQDELEAITGALGEQATAQNLSNEKLAGYQQGQQNYSQALAALSGNASLLSPTSYTSAATGAGQAATGAVHEVASEQSNLLGSILGGVLGAGTSFLTGGLSSIMKAPSPNLPTDIG